MTNIHKKIQEELLDEKLEALGNKVEFYFKQFCDMVGHEMNNMPLSEFVVMISQFILVVHQWFLIIESDIIISKKGELENELPQAHQHLLHSMNFNYNHFLEGEESSDDTCH